MTKKYKLNIPKTATLQDLIDITNMQLIEVDIDFDDRGFQTWLYDHKEWVIEQND